MARTLGRKRDPARTPQRRPLGRIIALVVFSVLVVAGPLAFGAVDRLVQIILAGLLAIGLLACPPQVGRLSVWANRLVLAGILVLIVKELAPATWFGPSEWRNILARDYGVSFPWTHHPEPGRALDVWLTGAIATVFFLWVRTLAAERNDRPVLAWSLFISAAVLAMASFATRGIDPNAIYGLRVSQGWTGFGPFPNRNHTACFLAMGSVLGAGCVAAAGARRNLGAAIVGVPLLGLILVALLETHSRGGIVALAAAMIFFLGFVLLKWPSWRTAAGIGAAALLIATLAAISGAETVARFSKTNLSGLISTQMRLGIWQDAREMWADARWLGHGAGSFASVFPMYQKVELDMQGVVHPESSWLLWLTELGLIPVLLGVIGLVMLVVPNLRATFASHSSFFLRAAGFAAAGALLVHAWIDVPAGRWGTGGFAIAALALACPRRKGAPPETRAPLAALVPAGAALFWSLPFFFDAPAWAPLQLRRIVDREMTTGEVPIARLERALACFPMNASLHHLLGLRLMENAPTAAAAQRHFRTAARLVPASWMLPQTQARACLAKWPNLGLHYWQLAVERGGHRVEELFGEALKETGHLPQAAAVWSSYVEAHPQLALVYAEQLPADQGRALFELWWRERALAPVTLRSREIRDYYRLAPRWGSADQLLEWTRRRPELKEKDFRAWARLLHAWGADDAAWRILASSVAEPQFPKKAPQMRRADLEARQAANAADPINARNLAHVLTEAGEIKAAQRLIFSIAARPGAPAWFIRKAAYALVAEGQLAEGVAMMLRDTAA